MIQYRKYTQHIPLCDMMQLEDQIWDRGKHCGIATCSWTIVLLTAGNRSAAGETTTQHSPESFVSHLKVGQGEALCYCYV